MPIDPDLETQRPSPSEDASDHGSGPSAPVMLAVAILVVVGGYFLSIKLKEMGRMQDCVMSGRTNCAPIVTPER